VVKMKYMIRFEKNIPVTTSFRDCRKSALVVSLRSVTFAIPPRSAPMLTVFAITNSAHAPHSTHLG
jgi:hypothetical protein